MRWWLPALLLLPVAALAHPFPRTAVLPGWTGLAELAPNVWVGPDAPPGITADVAAAEARVAAFWGEGPGPHRLVVCTEADCDAALGGGRQDAAGSPDRSGPLAQAFGAYLLVTYRRLLTEDPELRRAILTHEMSHLILARRVSILRLWTGEVPAWLNEGIAVLASEDPRFDLTPDVCQRLTDVTLPETLAEWNGESGDRNRPLYQAAACRARDWLSRNGLDDL